MENVGLNLMKKNSAVRICGAAVFLNLQLLSYIVYLQIITLIYFASKINPPSYSGREVITVFYVTQGL